jgi:hypothetical protein
MNPTVQINILLQLWKNVFIRSRGKQPQLGVVEESNVPQAFHRQYLIENSRWMLRTVSLIVKRP